MKISSQVIVNTIGRSFRNDTTIARLTEFIAQSLLPQATASAASGCQTGGGEDCGDLSYTYCPGGSSCGGYGYAYRCSDYCDSFGNCLVDCDRTSICC